MLPQVAIVTLLDVEPISDLLTAGRRSKTSKTKTLSTWATKEIRYLPTCVQTLDSKACFTQETEECDEHGALRAFSGWMLKIWRRVIYVYEELVCCDSTKAVIVNSSSEQNVWTHNMNQCQASAGPNVSPGAFDDVMLRYGRVVRVPLGHALYDQNWVVNMVKTLHAWL